MYFGGVPSIHTARPLPESTSWFQTVSGKLGFRAAYNHKPGPEGEHWVGGLWTWACGLHGGCSQTQRTFIQSKHLEMTPPAPSLSIVFPPLTVDPPPPIPSDQNLEICPQVRPLPCSSHLRPLPLSLTAISYAAEVWSSGSLQFWLSPCVCNPGLHPLTHSFTSSS